MQRLTNITQLQLKTIVEQPDTFQQCDSASETCRFTNLYYHSIEKRVFINNCDPSNVIKASERS